jgi:glycosyltransferase involved in cell wall biosynthesis
METTMLEVSVIICSHNPKLDYLRRTLDALRAQTLSKDRWELLLVDNASEPALAPLFEISWHPNARHVAESEVGVRAAYRRGINEAVANLLVFVDDDNLLDPSYLSEALAISREWVRLGAFGSGAIIPEFECEPEKHLTKYVHFLAIRQNDKDYWSNVIPTSTATPWGAGLCVRAEIARAYCGLRDRSPLKRPDRHGTNLFRGPGPGWRDGKRPPSEIYQDMEIGYFACSVGFGMGNFTRLKLTHLIPKERVRQEYLLRMVEGQELAWALLFYKWLGVIPKSPFSPKRLLSVVKATLLPRRVDRLAYFAQVRATIEARRIILATRNGMSNQQTTEPLTRFDGAPENQSGAQSGGQTVPTVTLRQ